MIFAAIDPVYALLVLVFGGGGLVGLLKLRTDNTSALVKASQEFAVGVTAAAKELWVPLTEQLAQTRKEADEKLAVARREADEKVALVRDRVAVLESEISVSRKAEDECRLALAQRDLRIESLEARLGGRRGADENGG